MVQEGLLWVWPVPGAWLESLGEQPVQLEDEPGWFGMPAYGFNENPVTFAAMLENALGELASAGGCERARFLYR